LAGANAVASWKVDLATSPPTLTPAGRLGTAWWPTDIAVMSDGSLVVADLKGHGAGPVTTPLPPDSGSGMAGSGGGVQHVTATSDADFAAGDAIVRAADAVGSLPGMPVVQCPAGADDFPVPATNTA